MFLYLKLYLNLFVPLSYKARDFKLTILYVFSDFLLNMSSVTCIFSLIFIITMSVFSTRVPSQEARRCKRVTAITPTRLAFPIDLYWSLEAPKKHSVRCSAWTGHYKRRPRDYAGLMSLISPLSFLLLSFPFLLFFNKSNNIWYLF